ncbi:hypothetical protein [Acidovorax sp. FG27]|uniref:hypothetical protein n=1 Tax=Acidovorax sp. FG27 TaxID=3133652 RepID=UPI0030E7ED90
MNEHVDPLIAAQLHRFWPVPPVPGISEDEFRRVRAEIEHREAIRDSVALNLQIRAAAQPGVS